MNSEQLFYDLRINFYDLGADGSFVLVYLVRNILYLK